MCKLIDIIIIEKCQVYLHTSNLQLSFKSEHGTNMFTAVFTETVSYFVDRGSNVYACLLDEGVYLLTLVLKTELNKEACYRRYFLPCILINESLASVVYSVLQTRWTILTVL